jgi:asparagine synthase (glutamine-hydrolysing)
MCGFTGFYNFNSNNIIDNHDISQMLKLQQHRGPDDSGIIGINTQNKNYERIKVLEKDHFKSPKNLIFGFNRLSILDLSPNGHQPMVSPDEKVILMMNGEIYNAFDFKDELIQKGHVFTSTTDTEIVLKMYIEYGLKEMVTKLNGMFSFAIYDFNLETLFLVRDRFGIKPLYILKEKNRIAFSSEIKSFKKLPDFKFEADYSQLDEFLLFRNLINSTLFKNISNIKPGTYISIKNNLVEETSYYNINEEGNDPIGKNISSERLENVLRKSVHSQMISDVKLGCQLSGGIDSSLVTYYAAEKVNLGNLETISITFKDPKFSEEKYINQVSDKLTLKAHKYEMNAQYYFDVIEKAIWHFEQPLNHPNTIGIYLISQKAKKHVTVLLSGEGADESLAGYSRFINTKKNKIITKSFLGGLKRNIKHAPAYIKYNLNLNKRMIMGTAFGNISTAKSLYQNFKLDKAISRRLSILKKLNGSDILKQQKYELLTYLPDLLMRQDKMSMAHSIENRVPFLDNFMVSTSLNIHEDLLITKHEDRLEGKKILKDIAVDKFGESFAYRDKMGFGIPLRAFMETEKFQTEWMDKIEPNIKKRGVFNVTEISKWVRNLKSASPEQLDAIWLMFGFEIWANQYLDNYDSN